MKTHTGKSIILGHRNLGEIDKIIYLYSEELGKIKVIAKGARKLTSKFTGHLETLNIGKTVLYFGPRNTILTEIETIQNFKKIRENFHDLECSLQVTEITDQLLFENQKINGLFEMFQECLENIEKSNKSQLHTIYYIIKMLDISGLLPNFKETYSSIEEKYLKFLNYVQTKKLAQIVKINLSSNEEDEIKNILSKIIENQTNRKLKSLTPRT